VCGLARRWLVASLVSPPTAWFGVVVGAASGGDVCGWRRGAASARSFPPLLPLPIRAQGERSTSGQVRCPPIQGKKAGSLLSEVQTDGAGVLLGLWRSMMVRALNGVLLHQFLFLCSSNCKAGQWTQSSSCSSCFSLCACCFRFLLAGFQLFLSLCRQ
jgi:hypothetical protein